MAKKIKVSGFTMVRNVIKLQYPFVEAVRSVLPLCDELIINVGNSDDQTDQLCQTLGAQSEGKIRLIHSNWETAAQKGGYQLKHHTDLALKECKGDWCLYIQADEAIHEDDHANILKAMERADSQEEVDGIVFDYLHFYGNYSHIMTGRRWYRREVRAFKNHRNILAFRDAQGFRKEGKRLKVVKANARVFHYGSVRTSAEVRVKSQEMSQWWGEAAEVREDRLRPVRHVGLKRFTQSHPAVMHTRVERNADYYDPSKCARRWELNEFKNLATLLFESVIPYRIGEFRNYDLISIPKN